MSYEQNAIDNGILGKEDYLKGLNHLQYDLLYGERYAYNGTNPYPASELVMGVEDTSIAGIYPSAYAGYASISGSNFTRWSKVYVNGDKVPTYYVNSSRLRVPEEYLSDGDTVVVNQMGSSDTVFRSTPEFLYDDPNTENTETLD